MKYQIWTNGVVFRIKYSVGLFWRWIRGNVPWSAWNEVFPKIRTFNSVDAARSFIEKSEAKKEENNPRWKMVEEC